MGRWSSRSRSRSRSSASRSGSASSRSSSSEPSSKRARSRSSSRESGEIRKELSPAPSKSPRIPKRSEFALAVDTVPPPPKLVSATAKERVRISEMAKARFEELAAGLFLPAADRNSLVKELPYVNSTLALVPSIDDQLRGVLFEKNVMVSMKLSDVWKLHETLLVGLNLREMIEKIGSDGEGGPFDAAVHGYLDVVGRLNGSSIRDLVRIERESVLKARNVHAFRAMPSLGRLPLDGSSFLHRVSNSVLPNLFGEVLRGELTSADSSAAKALERLRDKSDQNRSRGSSSHSRKNPRQPMSSRRTSGSSSSSKRPAEFKKSQGAPNARKAKK